MILTLNRSHLPENLKVNQGIVHTNNDQYLDHALKYWGHRDDAESSLTHVQPIPYCIVWDRYQQTILQYRRAGNEKRLYGKLSIGVGGHIEEEDQFSSRWPLSNLAQSCLTRELNEELGLTLVKEQRPTFLGYIIDNLSPVGRVHLGLCYLYACDGWIKPSEEINEPEWKSFESYTPPADLESWSILAFSLLSPYVNELGRTFKL